MHKYLKMLCMNKNKYHTRYLKIIIITKVVNKRNQVEFMPIFA